MAIKHICDCCGKELHQNSTNHSGKNIMGEIPNTSFNITLRITHNSAKPTEGDLCTECLKFVLTEWMKNDCKLGKSILTNKDTTIKNLSMC